MRLIHCADIHLGAMGRRLSGEVASQRRRELRDTFERMAKFAEENDVTAVLMSGDVFDTDNVSREERKEFYSIIKKYQTIDFLYLKGNHDKGELDLDLIPDNLRLFSDDWKKYSYGEVDIYGIELNEKIIEAAPLSLETDKNRINIVMLHGTVDEDIVIKNYATKGIDYMALGHIHSFSYGNIDTRGVYVYSGCLEGRGFDETGDKGFVLLNVNGGITYSFVKFAKRTIYDREISVTGCSNAYEAGEMVMNELSDISEEDGVRVQIVGEVNFERGRLVPEIESRLKQKFFLEEVKNRTVPYVDIDQIKGEISLRGRFVSMVLEDPGLSLEEKKEIIFEGIKAISESK